MPDTHGATNWLSDPGEALAEARASGLPLLLYWGVAWSPLCSRMEATVFASPTFRALAGSMVLLRLDGDAAASEAWAERFNVRTYPAVIVYQPDGTEVARLPCELAEARFIALLGIACGARQSVAQSLAAALSRERVLADDEWRLLSFYSWRTDERQVLRSLDYAAALASMQRGCALPEAALRLELHALHAVAMSGKGGINKRAAALRLEQILGDAAVTEAQMDIVIAYAVDLVRYLTVPQSPARTRLANAWAGALERLELDVRLNVTDQLAALRARVRLWRLGATLPSMDDVARARVGAALDSVSDPSLRHHLITTAVNALSDAGLLGEAERLLEQSLAGSHAPFYFMDKLAIIASKRGDPAAAARWHEQAWRQAPAMAGVKPAAPSQR